MRVIAVRALWALVMVLFGLTQVRAEMLVRDATGITEFGGGIRAERISNDLNPNRFRIYSPNSRKSGRGRNLDPDRPLADQVAEALGMWSLPIQKTIDYKRLIAHKYAREIKESDMRAWEIAAERESAAGPAIKAPGGFAIRGFGERKGLLRGPGHQRPYLMLLKPVGDDVLLVNAPGSVNLFIPETLKRSDAPQGANAYFMIDSGTCWGRGGICAPRDPAAMTASPSCFGDLPSDLYVHALAAQGPSKSRTRNLSLGKAKNAPVGQIDVYVPRTKKPLFLTLGAEGRTVWALNVARGANIAGVLVRGYHPKAISGVPEGVPVRFATKRGTDPACGGYDTWPGYGGAVESWARDVKAITGHGFHAFEGHGQPTHFLIGAWSGVPKTPEMDFFGNPQWGPDGEAQALKLDPIEEMQSSHGVADATFSLKNPMMYWVLLAIVIAIYTLIRRGVLRLMTGEPASKRPKVRTPSSVGWAYTKAVFSAGGGILALMMIDAPSEVSAGVSMFSVFGVILGLVIGVVCIVPAALFASVLSGMSIRRGLLDVAVGAATGALVAAMIGSMVFFWSLVLFPLAGALGGWQFWRARGYPGGNARVAQSISRAVDMVRNPSGRAVLDTARAFRSEVKVKAPRGGAEMDAPRVVKRRGRPLRE